MRRLTSAACPAGIGMVLDRRQVALDADPSKVQKSWKSFTRLKTYQELRKTLSEPLGTRRRCAYCSDSRAADVEHFWPKSLYPGQAFRYDNLLLVCPECNRAKLHRFPVSNSGLPLLVNPVADDPWDVLFFVPTTGLIDARITGIGESGEPVRDARGLATLHILGEILNSTPVLEGRKASWDVLVARLAALLDGNMALPSSQDKIFEQDDSFGLGEFLLNREGKERPEVRVLRERAPQRWKELRDLPRS
jgi:uncharacterized protein (TIGR02646 family)